MDSIKGTEISNLYARNLILLWRLIYKAFVEK